MYINTFKYTPKDVSCQLCTEYVKKLGCTALRCPWLAERIEAGVVGYREAVLETFPHERRLFQRLNLLIKHYPGSLWSNEQHERRMQYQCAVQGYIALTQLVPELQQMVDEKKIALSPAYQIAALTPKEQGLLLETIDSEQATPSLSQAQRMKKLSQSGELNEDTMLSIMTEQKKPEKNDITLSGEKLRKYFPRSYTPFQIENTIFKLLDAWQKKRQRDQSR